MQRFGTGAVVVIALLAFQVTLTNIFPTLTCCHGIRAGTASAVRIKSGSFVLVGGGTLPDSIRQCFLGLAGGKNAHIVVIPSASALADAPVQSYAFWKTADVKSVRVLHTTNRSEADDPRFYGLLRGATGVWISGGDQSRLAAIYGGTRVERELVNVIKRGGVVGGTSAGASIVSEVMMADAGKAGKGFGLLLNAVIDQHFTKRGRLPRLLAVLQSHQGQMGIGIDEETAVVIQGGEVTVLGHKTVTVAVPHSPRPNVRVYHAGSHFKQPTLLSIAAR
jgi:cyanophycinase